MSATEMVILSHNEDGTIKCYKKPLTVNATPAEDLDIAKLPLNGVGLVEPIDGVNYLVGYLDTDPFESFLRVHGGK